MLKKSNPSKPPKAGVMEHCETLFRLGEIVHYIYPPQEGRVAFLAKFKSVPLFMYTIISLRDTKNKQYLPKEGSFRNPKPKGTYACYKD